jgi:hypothetical protein
MTDGKQIAGRFAIVSNSEIRIKNKTVSLDSIVKIRKASTFSAIATPVAVTVGGICILGGIAGAAAGGYGFLATVVLLPPGLPLFIVPLTVNKHVKDKWKYEIVN